jgi:hypothetical protein
MARYVKGNDKTGAARGAGTYSKSYADLSDKPPPGFAKHYPEVEGPWRSFYKTPGAAPRVQDLIKGTDISRRVEAAGSKKQVSENKLEGDWGYSNEVSRGNRPKHVAGKRSYKRV